MEAATAAPVGDEGKAVDFAKITIAEAFKTLKVRRSSISTKSHIVLMLLEVYAD